MKWFNQQPVNHEIFNQCPSEFLTLTDQQRADRFLLPNQLDMPWGADADRKAEENGYDGVTSCVERLKGGERRLCHDELKGFVDFGTVNWNESDASTKSMACRCAARMLMPASRASRRGCAMGRA